MSAADWDGAVNFALAQTAGGADILDICLVSPGRDELQDAAEFYPRISMRDHPPLMIDTLNTEVADLALRHCGGGHFLNSASLADKDHLRRVCALAKNFNSSMVVACRDESGLAITRKHKLDVALRTLDFVDMDPGAIIIDVLALPVVTFPTGPAECFAAIESIHRRAPGVHTLLALSNFSFAMPAQERAAVEKSILQNAAQAGVDFVILNTKRGFATKR